MKLIQQGAEAKIFFDGKNNLVIKDRIPKLYRIKELDDKIRKRRTKAEKKLLEKASKIVNCPNPFHLEEFDKIKMPFIEGKKLSENLDLFPLQKQKEIMKTIGESVAKLHDADIIHGDLTTSNLILSEEKIFFIDFGLGYISKKIEDKAVDLHLLKHALEARHFKSWKILFDEFIEGYKIESESKKIIEKLTAVEKRGRYKEH